jgi:hypothetical protein
LRVLEERERTSMRVWFFFTVYNSIRRYHLHNDVDVYMESGCDHIVELFASVSQ